LTTYFAGCPVGVEPALASELEALGATELVSRSAGVQFGGTRETAMRACLWLRSATRVQEVLLERTVRSDKELYDAVRSLRWNKLIGVGATLGVDASLQDSFYTDPRFLVHRVKDAVVDRMRADRGDRPNVDRHRPDVPLFALLHRDTLQVSRVWAPSLHRRGYRDKRSKSPLNEALAAGLLRLAGVDGTEQFLDPMCGSGTLLIEAALAAAHVAPGLGRPFPFERWPDADARSFQTLVAEARGSRRAVEAFRGFDRDPEAVAIARGAAKRAGVDVRIEAHDVATLDVAPAPNLVVTNPPWGERVGEGDDLVRSWNELGRFLKRSCVGATAWVLSGNAELTRHLGMKASRRIPLPVGPIACKFLRYEVTARRS
jgi:23S rRNA G2445 N2-methylase RlmL